jgi:hypothetical protein
MGSGDRFGVKHGLGARLHEVVAEAYDEAQHAIELDTDSAIAHAMLAWVLDHQGFPGRRWKRLRRRSR